MSKTNIFGKTLLNKNTWEWCIHWPFSQWKNVLSSVENLNVFLPFRLLYCIIPFGNYPPLLDYFFLNFDYFDEEWMPKVNVSLHFAIYFCVWIISFFHAVSKLEIFMQDKVIIPNALFAVLTWLPVFFLDVHPSTCTCRAKTS